MRGPRPFGVLAGNGPLGRTLLAYLLFDVVEVAIWLAVILWAFGEGGAALAGAVAVVQLLPAALVAPPLAGLGDRMSRGTALAAAHLGVAVTTLTTTLALAADASVAVVTLASATATTALAIARPLHFAALPQLARDPVQLVAANGLSGVCEGIALCVGPILAGLGTEVAGPWVVLAGSTVAAVVAVTLCVRLGLRPPVRGWRGGPGWRGAFAGLGPLWRDRAVIVLLLVLATRFVIAGAMDLLGVSLSADVLGLGESAAGFIIGSVGIGALLGGAVGGAVARRPRLAAVVLASGLLQGFAIAAVVVLVALAPVVVLLGLSGMAGSVLMVAGRTLLHRVSDERALARVFAVQEGTSLLALALGAAVAPVLITWLEPAGAFLPFGVGAALFTLAGYVLVRRLDARAVILPLETELLRGVSFLAALPRHALEQLARRATWVEVAEGRIVIEQGSVGDSFYVVGEGELGVSVDGVLRPHRLLRGDGFGEIALLRAVPRTATVTALTDSRLLTIDAGDFLAAVTGSPDGHAKAAEVAEAHLARDASGFG